MTTLTKITRNFQVTIPPAARRILKLKVGDFIEATTRRGDVILRPANVMTRESFEQELHRRLQEGLADAKAGRTSGPFDTVDDLIAHLHRVSAHSPHTTGNSPKGSKVVVRGLRRARQRRAH